VLLKYCFSNHRTVRSLALVFVSLLCAMQASAAREYQLQTSESALGEQFIVRLTAGSSPSAVLASVLPGAQFSVISEKHGIYLVLLPGTNVRSNHVVSETTASMRTASRKLAVDPRVVYVQPNRIRSSQALLANDPQITMQWALQTIQATGAWQVAPNKFLTGATAGGNRTKIAILDTGADCTHPDFANAGTNATDSAAGGQLSYSLSRAYYPTTISSPACPWQDDHGHGTHTAGIIAAAANNSVGVAGMAFPVQLMVYKVLDASGSGSDAVIAAAIIDAANNGAAVISMSLGSSGYDPVLQTAVDYAWQMNSLVVAAAGNYASNQWFYPADANYVLGVAATDSNDARAWFSNYGAGIAVAAPGVSILSTLPGNNYGYLSGTSMATPFVAGLGGLLSMVSPGVSAAAMRMRIENSSDNSNPGGAADQYLGYGRINVTRALTGHLRAATQGGIVGQVVDASRYYGVSNITVTVGGQTIVTDLTGMFRFYGLGAGQYTILSSGGGFDMQSQQVVVTPGADTPFTIVMGGAPAVVTGTLSKFGIPTAGAVVQAISGGLIEATAVTGTNGQYFLYVQAGTYTLKVSCIYCVTTASSPIAVAVGNTATLNLNGSMMGVLNGTIKLNNGVPASDASVLVSGAVTGSTTALTPDAQGNFSTIGLPPDNYLATASLTGLQSIATGTVIANDATPTLNLQFPDNGQNTILALIASKSGPANSRQWTFSFTNNGTQTTQGISIAALSFAQQGGAICTPVVLTSLPVIVGNVSPGAQITHNLNIDFSTCATSARFKVTMPFTANYQSANGTLTTNQQFQ
jgi:thermitase